VLTLRAIVPADLADQAEAILRQAPSMTALTRIRGAAVEPPGDVLTANLERDAINDVVTSLKALGVTKEGSLDLNDHETWISERALAAEEKSPDNDNVVWAEVIEQAYAQTRLSGIFIAFMIMATMLAAIAVITDSPILVVGAMVLGPEFMCVVALGLALVRHKHFLLVQSVRTLIAGFAIAIAVTVIATEIARLVGLVSINDITASRPGVEFIYEPNWWSFIVAIIAASAGILSLTSSMATGIIGVFISVTTIPAAGNIAVATVFGQWNQVAGSGFQLVINIVGMAFAGWITLLIRSAMSHRVSRLLAQREQRRQLRRQRRAPATR
jgi:uncharacterized hydrophobic protein (TIGR00271 family)